MDKLQISESATKSSCRLRRNLLYEIKYKSTTTRVTLTFLLVSVLLIVLCIPGRCLGKVGTSTGSDEKEDTSSAGIGDSVEDDPEMEMTEYLDDEVRFVTEDDFMYEEERSHYRDFHQGASRTGSSRISHQYERCPPLPDANAVAKSGLCEVKKCERDDECSKDGSVICCYNGCIYSCLMKVNPPIAFDWVEETGLKYNSKEHELLQDSPGSPSPKALLNAEISPETITLPGGCYLNEKQYHDLLLFRKFDHIKSCSCSKGEVFCEITHEDKILTG